MIAGFQLVLSQAPGVLAAAADKVGSSDKGHMKSFLSAVRITGFCEP
jgi:hypothetical protein